MTVYSIKKGDTDPPVQGIVTDADGNAKDLTQAASVRFLVAGLPPQTGTIVAPPTDGRIRYEWQAGQTTTLFAAKPAVGGKTLHFAEFEVTWNDGGIQTVPSNGYIPVKIWEDLG